MEFRNLEHLFSADFNLCRLKIAIENLKLIIENHEQEKIRLYYLWIRSSLLKLDQEDIRKKVNTLDKNLQELKISLLTLETVLKQFKNQQKIFRIKFIGAVLLTSTILTVSTGTVILALILRKKELSIKKLHTKVEMLDVCLQLDQWIPQASKDLTNLYRQNSDLLRRGKITVLDLAYISTWRKRKGGILLSSKFLYTWVIYYLNFVEFRVIALIDWLALLKKLLEELARNYSDKLFKLILIIMVIVGYSFIGASRSSVSNPDPAQALRNWALPRGPRPELPTSVPIIDPEISKSMWNPSPAAPVVSKKPDEPLSLKTTQREIFEKEKEKDPKTFPDQFTWVEINIYYMIINDLLFPLDNGNPPPQIQH
jgi:hypothetical protein